MANIYYPGISKRILAMLLDSFILVMFMFIITYVFSLFESVPENAKMIAIVFIFFLYDPLFTSVFGGTIGTC